MFFDERENVGTVGCYVCLIASFLGIFRTMVGPALLFEDVVKTEVVICRLRSKDEGRVEILTRR